MIPKVVSISFIIVFSAFSTVSDVCAGVSLNICGIWINIEWTFQINLNFCLFIKCMFIEDSVFA